MAGQAQGEVRRFDVDRLHVRVFADKASLGAAAAAQVAQAIREAVAAKGSADVVVATGASQFEFLDALVTQDVPWPKVRAFHLDEYIGLDDGHPASFRRYLRERLFSKVSPAEVHYVRGDTPDPHAEAKRYGNLLAGREIDVSCIGIGENGHIAFNDPPVADFDDPVLMKVVELDEACRRQQLGEGWFPTLADVPTHALTQTVPAMMRARQISCVVPDARKAKAVRDTLRGPISTACPASVLRRHPDCTLWLDEPAAGMMAE